MNADGGQCHRQRSRSKQCVKTLNQRVLATLRDTEIGLCKFLGKLSFYGFDLGFGMTFLEEYPILRRLEETYCELF